MYASFPLPSQQAAYIVCSENMLPITISEGTKEDGMDRPAPFVVCGLYTEYADFIYHPTEDTPSSANNARNEAYKAQMMLLQEAWEIATSVEASDAIYEEMIHLKEQRRGYPQPWDKATEPCINDARVEDEIFDAILLARVKLQFSPFPSTPDKGTAYRVAARDKPPSSQSTPSSPQTPKRKRADSVVHEDEDPEQETAITAPTAPRRNRANALHCTPAKPRPSTRTTHQNPPTTAPST